MIEHPQYQNVSLSDGFFMLYCSLAGFPAPTTITWFHNGSQLQGMTPLNEVVNSYTVASTVRIAIVGSTSTGFYFCRAITTHYGTIDSDPAFVLVQGKCYYTLQKHDGCFDFIVGHLSSSICVYS